MRYAPATMGKNSFGIWNEEAYQLWLDVRTLHDILEHADAHSLRVELIEHGLNRFSVQLDMEQPLAKRREAYKSSARGAGFADAGSQWFVGTVDVWRGQRSP